MAAFTCRTCKAPTNKVIYAVGLPETVCPSCYQMNPRHNVNLHQTADAWVGPNGKKHRMSVGKQSEIDHRRLAEDNWTVINSESGKEAQY